MSERPRIRVFEDDEQTFLLNTTPVIDVFLMLIIFFMISASFGQASSQFGIQLPPSATQEETPVREVVIAIDQNQKIYLDREDVSLNQLYSRMRASPLKTRVVSVQADRRVPYGMIMKVISVARKSGFYDFAFDVIYEGDLVR